MTDPGSDNPGLISRRDVLRRGAVVGGASAVAWAAPGITSYGARAFATNKGTPPPGGSKPWGIIWLKRRWKDKHGRWVYRYHRVKYQFTGSQFTATWGINHGAITDDPTGIARQLYNTEEARARQYGLQFDSSRRNDVTHRTAGSGLQIRVPNETYVIGWLLYQWECTGGGTNAIYASPFRSMWTAPRKRQQNGSQLAGPSSNNWIQLTNGWITWTGC